MKTSPYSRKPKALGLALLGCALIAGSTAVADPEPPHPRHTRREHHDHPNFIERVGHFFQKLARNIEVTDSSGPYPPPPPGFAWDDDDDGPVYRYQPARPDAYAPNNAYPAPDPRYSQPQDTTNRQPNLQGGDPRYNDPYHGPGAAGPNGGANEPYHPFNSPPVKPFQQPKALPKAPEHRSGEAVTTPNPNTADPSPAANPQTRAIHPEIQVGAKTGKAGRVKSPYPPYTELDVTGLASGSLAKDPSTGKIFRVP